MLDGYDKNYELVTEACCKMYAWCNESFFKIVLTYDQKNYVQLNAIWTNCRIFQLQKRNNKPSPLDVWLFKPWQYWST